jgi:hypothetical protein
MDQKTMDGFQNYALLAGVGLIASALNAVAGGGWFLNAPFWIVFGLPGIGGQMAPIVWLCFFKALRLLEISALGQALEWNGRHSRRARTALGMTTAWMLMTLVPCSMD